MNRGFNPHFIAYASANGNTPERQLEIDDKQYPGGRMAGYLCWMAQKRTEYMQAFPHACFPNGDIIDHAHWGHFLKGVKDE